MTWTYGGDPSANDRDAVRFTIQDTETSEQLVSDEEIAYLLSEAGDDVIKASIAACEAISRRFARKASQTTGRVSVNYSERAKVWIDLADKLRTRALVENMSDTPYAGGISQDDVDSVKDDSDRVAPAFTKGMHDNESTYVDAEDN